MQQIIRRFFTEPFIQFLILGGLLFVLVYYIQQKTDKQSRNITIGNEQVNLMIVNYKSQTGNLPTKQQLDAMIDNYIKEEISYREAKKMGLDKDDEIIRRRLSQKFDFLQTDLKEEATPTEDDLEQFYKNNPALFQKEATVSFSHIYFTTDKSTDSIAKQRALQVLQQLQSTSLQRAPEKGDRFALQYDYTGQAAVDVQQNFGNTPMQKELFNAPVNTWAGPVQSGYGWHLIFVSKRDSTAAIPFASIKEEVKTKWMEAAKAAQNKKVFDQLNEKYIINRAYLTTK
jgi:parvulin-like peptidyl-prolyl isomerase